jgi:biotin carboxyl carrier protein
MTDVTTIDRDLSLLGTDEAPRAKERLLDAGAPALTRILSSACGRPDSPALPKRHDAVADLTDVLVAFACDYPDDFVKILEEIPTARAALPLVIAAPQLPPPLREEVLVAALDSPAGDVRWEAFSALAEAGHPAVTTRLNDFLWDGHELVVFAALRVAAGHGDARSLPRLLSLAEASQTPVGARHHAWEAIEAIGAREGLTELPKRPPPPSIRLPAAVPIFSAWGKATVTTILVSEGEPVKRGQDVAEIACFDNAIVVPAPCDGVVVEVALQEGDECKNEQAVVWVEGPLLWER